MEKLPDFIIIPMEWLKDYADWGTNIKQVLTPQAVVECFAISPTLEGGLDDYEEKFMNLANQVGGESLFENNTPDEYVLFEEILNNLVQKYYETLNEFVPFKLLDSLPEYCDDEYLLVEWVNPTTPKLGLKSRLMAM